MDWTKEQSEVLGKKLENIWSVIGELTPVEWVKLDEIQSKIEVESCHLEAIAGVLVDFNKADTKLKLAEHSINRIKGLGLIRMALDSAFTITLNYAIGEFQKKELEEKLGL